MLSYFWNVTGRALHFMYTPLIWLHEHTPLKEPLDWYVNVWLRPTFGRSAGVIVLGLLALGGSALGPTLKQIAFNLATRDKRIDFRGLLAWLVRLEFRRVLFAVLGVLLAGGGAFAVLIGLVWLARGWENDTDLLAKGIGASAVGFASLWLAFHPRSPLRGKSEP